MKIRKLFNFIMISLLSNSFQVHAMRRVTPVATSRLAAPAVLAATAAVGSTMMPRVGEARREFSKIKLDKPINKGELTEEVPYKIRLKYNPFVVERGSLYRDPAMESSLRSKYPHIKVPKIYSHTGKMMPSAAAFLDSVVYNPDKVDPKVREFIMLHELGHIRHYYSRLFMYSMNSAIRPSIILAVCFKLISLKYGAIGFVLAPKLFLGTWSRFYEEPSADNFAVRHARSKDVLKGGRDFFSVESGLKELEKGEEGLNKKLAEKILKNKLLLNMYRPIDYFHRSLFDLDHPNVYSRIHKIQRAIDEKPNWLRISKIVLLMSFVTYAIDLMYHYSQSHDLLEEGLKKLKDIENNFEQHCDNWEIPPEGRPSWKYFLEVVQAYLLEVQKKGKKAVDEQLEQLKEQELEALQVDQDIEPVGPYVSLEDKDRLFEQYQQELQQEDRLEQEVEEEKMVTLTNTLQYLSPAMMKQRIERALEYIQTIDFKRWPDHGYQFLSQLLSTIQEQIVSVGKTAGRTGADVAERLGLLRIYERVVKNKQQGVEEVLEVEI